MCSAVKLKEYKRKKPKQIVKLPELMGSHRTRKGRVIPAEQGEQGGWFAAASCMQAWAEPL